MRSKFVYVFKIEDKERLMELGYNLIHEDKQGHIFVFENNPSLNNYILEQNDDGPDKKIAHVMTDVLTF